MTRFMMEFQTSLLLIFLTGFTLVSSQKGDYRSYLETAMDMIAKAKDNMPCMEGCNCTKIEPKPVDCADIQKMGHSLNGVYEIWPMNRVIDGKSLKVYCDMITDGGGWTVIQRRGDFNTSKDYFFRDWKSYKEGFGNIEQDFWLGNRNIYALTNQKLYSVRFDLKDAKLENGYALYDTFYIDDENRNYTLHISMHSTGDAGNSMKYHNNNMFSTFDRDESGNGAKKFNGGWWYGIVQVVQYANLNGIYYKELLRYRINGLIWTEWKRSYESLEWTEIKIRPKYFKTSFS